MDHAIDTGKGRAAALVAVRVKFLLGEDITAVLAVDLVSIKSTLESTPARRRNARQHLFQSTHLTRERHHAARIRAITSSQRQRSEQIDDARGARKRPTPNATIGAGREEESSIGGLDELECGEETGRRRLSLADEKQSMRASRMHELRRVFR